MIEKRQPINEDQLTELLVNFNPEPTYRFYAKMAKAPWHTRSGFTIYTMQAAVLVAAVLGFLWFTPSANPLLNATNTPTASSTSESTHASGLPMSQVGTLPPSPTPQPETTPTPLG